METSNPFAPSSASHMAGGAGLWAQPSDLEPLKADRFRRWLGALIDNLVPIVFAVPTIALSLLGGSAGVAADELGVLGYVVGYMVISALNWFLIAARGQTIGKMLVGTRIVTETGGPVDFVKGVVVRNWVFSFANAFIGVLSLLDAVFIFGEDKQCLHDKVAKTIVVDARAWNPYA